MKVKKPTSVKEQLLKLLKKNRELSIEEIMQHFTISEIAVRKHLQGLARQKFIEVIQHKKEIGRPYHTYQLSDKGHSYFPHRYQELSVQLLKDLEQIYGEEAVDTLLEKQSDRDKERLSEAVGTKRTDEKISLLVDQQNESGYMLEWSKVGDNEYVLKNYHCPFMEAAVQYPSMCQHEKKMFSKVFSEGTVSAESFITEGETCCKWKITLQEK